MHIVDECGSLSVAYLRSPSGLEPHYSRLESDKIDKAPRTPGTAVLAVEEQSVTGSRHQLYNQGEKRGRSLDSS